jgi:hypothetical protein
MAIIKPNNNTISAITALPASIPTGKVLQIVSTSTTAEYGTTNSSFNTWSDMNRTITAISANSKFMCILNAGRIMGGSGSPNCDIQFTDGTNNSNFIRMFKSLNITNVGVNPSVTCIISGNHSAGASLTISVQGRTSTGTFTIGDSGGTSTMFVLEIE